MLCSDTATCRATPCWVTWAQLCTAIIHTCLLITTGRQLRTQTCYIGTGGGQATDQVPVPGLTTSGTLTNRNSSLSLSHTSLGTRMTWDQYNCHQDTNTASIQYNELKLAGPAKYQVNLDKRQRLVRR